MFGQKFLDMGKLSLIAAIGISFSFLGCSQEEAKTEKTPQEMEEVREKQIDIMRSMEGGS